MVWRRRKGEETSDKSQQGCFGELIPPSSQPGKRGSHWSSEASMQRSQGGSGGGMNLGGREEELCLPMVKQSKVKVDLELKARALS